MDEHLIHGGDLVQGRAAQHPAAARQPAQAAPGQGTFMKKWFRTSKAIVMYLNNGTLQVRIINLCLLFALIIIQIFSGFSLVLHDNI